jgi:cytochrome b involved in lipid metabolism
MKYWLVPWSVYLVWRSAFLHGAYVPALTLPLPFTATEVHVQLSVQKYPRWLRLLSNDVASLLSATRLLQAYLRDYARQLPAVPSANASQLLPYLIPAAATDAALAEEREKLRLSAIERECDELRSELDFGTPLSALPSMSRATFARDGRSRKLVLCDGLVFDLAKFHRSHPGGEAILTPFFGLDISRAFNGGVYNHSNGARNLSRHFMIARIVIADDDDDDVITAVRS